MPYEPDAQNQQIAFLADKYKNGELDFAGLQQALSRFDLPVRPPDQPMPGYGPDPTVMGTPQQIDPQTTVTFNPMPAVSNRELAGLVDLYRSGKIGIDEYQQELNRKAAYARQEGQPIPSAKLQEMATLSSEDRQMAKDMLAKIQKRSAGDGG